MPGIQHPKILFSSVSAKIGLYNSVLEDAKRFDQSTTLIGADCDLSCPAAGIVERFARFPAIDDLTKDTLVDELKKLEVTHVLPTRDGELQFWSGHKKFLLENGIITWVSAPHFVQVCSDKLQFYEKWKDNVVPAISTQCEISKVSLGRWVVKERYGAGARDIGLNLSTDDAIRHAAHLRDPIFQPFIEGSEFTAETWIDRNGSCRSVLLRWRQHVVDGESHKTEVFRNPEWENSLKSTFSRLPGGHGHCLAQVLVDRSGKLRLIEINPRLGGASALSLHAGLHSVEWNLLESYGHLDCIPSIPDFAEGMKLIKLDGKQLIRP